MKKQTKRMITTAEVLRKYNPEDISRWVDMVKSGITSEGFKK